MSETRPNILWLCTDQQRYDTIHCLNNPYIRTPHIDQLVSEGVAFTHAYCQSPICTPSRASFLTGMYPSSVHACINGNQIWDEAAPLVTKTLADAGYDCGLAGKFHLSSAQGRIEPRVSDGYRVFDWSHHPGDDWAEGHDYIDWIKSKGYDYRQMLAENGYIPKEFHQTTWCAERTIEFMTQEREGPWLFSFNCFDPHAPFDAPQELVDRFDLDQLPGPLFQPSDLKAQNRLSAINFQSEPTDPADFNGKLYQAKYWAMIELIDENVGRIMAALEESGQRDNTIIIFTSDHGDMTGDHGLRLKGCRFYEALVRVPLIISYPEKFESGLQTDALVELTDLVPTLLDAANLPIPDRVQGHSLWPILSGQTNPDYHRDFVRSEFYQALPDKTSYATMIRDRRYKLVNYHGHNLGELFDLDTDPGEFNNLWDDDSYADIRFGLMKRSFDSLAMAVDIGSPRISGY